MRFVFSFSSSSSLHSHLFVAAFVFTLVSYHPRRHADLNSKVVLANDEPLPCLLIANKCDLPGVTIDATMLDACV